jgi:hypothetical protein
VTDLGDKNAELQLIKVGRHQPPACGLTLLQAQNEAEIATLNGVIERLRQSIEELAAAAQVAYVHKMRDWRSSSHEPLCCAGVEWTAGGAERKNCKIQSPSTNIRRVIHHSFLKQSHEKLFITIRSI